MCRIPSELHLLRTHFTCSAMLVMFKRNRGGIGDVTAMQWQSYSEATAMRWRCDGRVTAMRRVALQCKLMLHFCISGLERVRSQYLGMLEIGKVYLKMALSWQRAA